MRPLTLDTPKPLLKIGDTTFLDHIFSALPPSIDEVVLVIGYLGEKIRSYCGNTFHGKKVYYAEGSSKGNAYSFLSAKPFFHKGERFVVLYGDELVLKEELDKCLAHPYAWLCYEVEDPTKSGIATIKDGKIVAVVEKPQNPRSNLAAVGLMVADERLFNYVPYANENGEYYITSLMNQFVRDNEVVPIIGTMNRPQFTTPEDIPRLEKMLGY